MASVTPKLGKAVLKRLAAENYRPILIGGLAIALAGFGGTVDVDVIVPEAQFAASDALGGEGLLIYSTIGGWVTNGRLTLPDGTTVPFDILNPAKYVGSGHSGDEFFAWVERRGSRLTSYGRVAVPAVVYYTRLLVKGSHGELYIERIRRDLAEGAPREWLTGALSISRKFGTERTVAPKVKRLRQRSGSSSGSRGQDFVSPSLREELDRRLVRQSIIHGAKAKKKFEERRARAQKAS